MPKFKVIYTLPDCDRTIAWYRIQKNSKGLFEAIQTWFFERATFYPVRCSSDLNYLIEKIKDRYAKPSRHIRIEKI